MLFTEKLEIVSPVCVLMMVISSPKAMELALSSIFLCVLQFTSLQNLKVCALVHCTLETSTWAETAVGIINKNKTGKLGRKNLIPGIVISSYFNFVHVMLQWSATLQLKHGNCKNSNVITLYMRERRVPIDVKQSTAREETRMNTNASLFWRGGAQNCITIRLDYTHDATKDRDVSRIDEIKFTFNFKYLGAIGKDDVIGLMSNSE